MMESSAIGGLLYSWTYNTLTSLAPPKIIKMRNLPLQSSLRLVAQAITDNRSMLIVLISRKASKSISTLGLKTSIFTNAKMPDKAALYRGHSRITMRLSHPCMCIPVSAKARNMVKCPSSSYRVQWIGRLSFGLRIRDWTQS